jgi:hypothetical protein
MLPVIVLHEAMSLRVNTVFDFSWAFPGVNTDFFLKFRQHFLDFTDIGPE